MRVLVACEESQTVCKAFRVLGHEAYSCDIQDCSGGHPEWHLKQDVLPLLKEHWDLIIAHPPCTYMSKAGARWMYPTAGNISPERYRLSQDAKAFFMEFYNCDCEHIAIENPVPLKVVGLPAPTQSIQPYEFGEPYSKKTLLWLKGLPLLMPTNILHTHTVDAFKYRRVFPWSRRKSRRRARPEDRIENLPRNCGRDGKAMVGISITTETVLGTGFEVTVPGKANTRNEHSKRPENSHTQ